MYKCFEHVLRVIHFCIVFIFTTFHSVGVDTFYIFFSHLSEYLNYLLETAKPGLQNGKAKLKNSKVLSPAHEEA